MTRNATALAVSGAVVYLAVIAVSMGTLPFDLWGGFVVAPALGVAGVRVVRRMFHGNLHPLVFPLTLGLLIKAIGSLARYWVAFDAYGGTTDAQRYHDYARNAAAAFWNGSASLGSVLPSGTGTHFVERTTSLLYTILGTSKFAGFLIFGWLAWFGTVLFVRAAIIAVPKVRRLRYAWLLMVWPSVVYWPASIGKEALMCLMLGAASYGLARLFERQGFWWPVAITALSLTGVGLVRAHLTFIWLLGLLPAMLVALGRTLRAIGRAQPAGGRVFATVLVIVVACAAAWSVGNTAVQAIRPSDEAQTFSRSVTEALRETTRRSDHGGSNFTPPAINGPLDWPYAAFRTLTRPFPNEARGTFQFLTAADSLALLALFALSWRRVIAVVHWQVRVPYVALVTTVMFAGAIAYAHFANLGILARQRTLLTPFVLLLPCLPDWQPRRRQRPTFESDLVRPAALVTSPQSGT